jgi:regulator of protease activity HflC (stomatin/prohibitin superfamily)
MNRYTFALVAMLVFSGCSCVSVEAGNAGVETHWGHVTGVVEGEGMKIVGWSTDLHEMSVRLQNLEEENIPCRSHDNVSVLVDVTASYVLVRSSAAKVYKQLGDDYAALVILPALRSTIRDAVASVEALAVAQARSDMEAAAQTQLRAAVAMMLRNQHLPPGAIRIDSVQLRNVDLPASLTSSIESIQRQRNAALERTQALATAQQEAERARAEQEGRNRVALLAAQNQADVRRVAGESEALYNRTVSASMTPTLVELRRIEAQRAIATNPNAQLVVMGGGGGGSSPIVIQAPR